MRSRLHEQSPARNHRPRQYRQVPRDYLSKGKVSRCELTAVCDAFAPLDQFKPLRPLRTRQKLFRSGEVDAVIIATPHYQHTTLGIAALEAGLHIMVEKPISAHKADAERLIAAARSAPRQVFAGMFQLRTEPRYLKIQKLIREGHLGEITRVIWIITDWYRTDAYYASGGWRATWKGEGGGVLLNQCLHNLDTLAWLLRDAQARPRLLRARPLSQHRGRRRRHRLPGIRQRRDGRLRDFHRRSARARTDSRSPARWARSCWRITS